MSERKYKKGRAQVAWFKLSELIDRGEREKALSLYRLLSHSFEDRAYALQVEADILWSFDDSSAIDKYKEASYLYMKEKKNVLAASLHENLYSLRNKSNEALGDLIVFYASIDEKENFKIYYTDFIARFSQKKITQEEIQDMYLFLLDSVVRNQIVTKNFIVALTSHLNDEAVEIIDKLL